MLGVQLDRFDHQVKSIRAVDFARHTVSLVRKEVEAFGEVQQAIYTLSVAVEHKKHGARAVFHPREQEEMIGAEVEHRGRRVREREALLPPIVSAVVGLPVRLL
jgi:hypothetical protein